MDQKFSAQIRAGGGYNFLKLRGTVDEDNNLTALTQKLDAEMVILDLSEVERINSYGVRDWVNWLGELETAGKRIVMVRCSPAIVGQANMVTNFSGDAVIMSFFAPYYCGNCDLSVNKLLTIEQFQGVDPIVSPSFLCEECGGALEFDDFEESYFAFLQAMDPERISAEVRRVVDEVAPDLERKIKALNEGRITQLSGPVHTASIGTPANTPGSGAYSRLIRSASEAQRAGGQELPEKIREAVGRGGESLGGPRGPTAPATSVSVPASAPPRTPATSGSSVRSLIVILLPYVLIVLALMVVAVLLFLVLTIK